jgi:hypothetical protein
VRHPPASAGTDGVSAKAEASVVSFSGSVKLGSVTVTGSVNVVAAGGQLSITSRGVSVGANELVGADLSIQWGGRDVKTVSSGTN